MRKYNIRNTLSRLIILLMVGVSPFLIKGILTSEANDGFQSGGIHLGSRFHDRPEVWALHDSGDVAVTKTFQAIGQPNVMAKIKAINPDFVSVHHSPFFAIHEYHKNGYEQNPDGKDWFSTYWRTVAVDNDYLMRTNGIDPATGERDTFAAWLRNYDINITLPGCIDSLVKLYADFYGRLDYVELGGVVNMVDFVTYGKIYDFKAAQDPAYQENEIGEPDLDGDWIAFDEDLSYGDTGVRSSKVFTDAQKKLFTRLRDECDNRIAWIANGSASVKDYAGFIPLMDGCWWEEFPKWYATPHAPWNMNCYYGALHPDNANSLGRVVKKPYKTDRGGPYVFIESAYPNNHYRNAACSLLWDEVYCIFRNDQGIRRLWFPEEDFGVMGLPKDDAEFVARNGYGLWRRFYNNGWVDVFIKDGELTYCEYIVVYGKKKMKSAGYDAAHAEFIKPLIP